MLVRTILLVLCCLTLLGAFLSALGKLAGIDVGAALILAALLYVAAQLPWKG